MSAIAGRVLLIPKGNYDSTATYTMLDMVVYNGSSYICKQECTGIVPTNTTYWMLNASGSAVAYINDIGDVVITNPTNGQVLMYNSTTQKWVNGTLTLNGLNDTQFASLSDGQVLKYNATSQKWENADEAGGILPHLIVISETGSTVTATKGQTVITATETSTGHFECDLTEFGTWTIDAILGGDDAQVSLVVDTVKVYTVDDSHFHADITVKYPSGATCNLAGQGESYYATGSPYTFTVHHAGQYTITVVYDGQTYTETVTVTTTGEIISKVVPSPSSVPANDINMWLWFGGVSGSYSSLSDILADSTALSTLMASEDAVDYLVRCDEWITSRGLVPTMTSNTTPSGEVIFSGEVSSYQGYKAFNGTTNYWFSGNAPAWIGYDFVTPQKCVAFKYNNYTHDTNYLPKTFKIQGSNDKTTWADLYEGAGTQTQNQEIKGTFNNSTSYRYYRIYIDSIWATSYNQACLGGLQFYSSKESEGLTDNQSAMSYIGLNNYCADTLLADEDWCEGICNSTYFESVLNAKVPTMTSNTTPSGVASASSIYDNTFMAYKGFTNLESTWISQVGDASNAWLQYQFIEQVCIKSFTIRNYYYSSTYPTLCVQDYQILGSNDGTNFEQIYSGTIDSSKPEYTYIKGIQGNNKYKYIRFKCVNTYGGDHIGISLQYYGRKEV